MIVVSADGQGPQSAMTDVTSILAAIEQGDQLAAENLLPLVYDELRRLAARSSAASAPARLAGDRFGA